jgi:hypothetical protein
LKVYTEHYEKHINIFQINNSNVSEMKIHSLIFFLTFYDFHLSKNEPQLVFNINQKGMHIVNFDKVNTSINFDNSNLLLESTNYIIEGFDYNLRDNILIWRDGSPSYNICILPIDKR